MNWVSIHSDNWKPHVIPADFADALVAEMHEREFRGEIVRRPDIVQYGLDREGMCRTDRPIEKFAFAGLVFGVPSEHVTYFYTSLVTSPLRKFGTRTYYKLHSHWNCLVLTPVLRRQLLRALARRVDRAEAKATAFYRDKKPTNVVLAEVAEKVAGVKVPPEALGPDRQARFRKKALA